MADRKPFPARWETWEEMFVGWQRPVHGHIVSFAAPIIPMIASVIYMTRIGGYVFLRDIIT